MLTYKSIEELKAGATFDHSLNLVTFKQGYQVGITNNRVSKEDVKIELGKAAKIAKDWIEETGHPHYVGIWNDGNDWFIDISIYVPEKDNALYLGSIHQQQAIFNWADKSCIEVK